MQPDWLSCHNRPLPSALSMALAEGFWMLQKVVDAGVCGTQRKLLAVIQGADALLAAGMPEAARALLAPFTGGGA